MTERAPIHRIEPTRVATTATEQPVFDPRNERQRDVLAKLERGTEAILTSEGFAAYLRSLAKFHAYSFANVILIHAQRPDATLVNSYRRWRELGRQVKRGERAIRIFFPMVRAAEAEAADPDTGDPAPRRVVTGFGIGNVFDVAQTEGAPVPEPTPITELTGTDDASTALQLRLSRFLIDEGLTLSSEEMHGGKRGYWHPAKRKIALKKPDGWSPFAIGPTRTLAHEAAHFLAEHRGQVDRDDAECVAEGAAYATLHRFGIDTGLVSFPYLAGWARDKTVLRRNLAEIQRIADRLITAVEGVGDPYADGYGAIGHIPDRNAALDEHLVGDHGEH